MYNKKSRIELQKSLNKEEFKRITCSFYKYCSIDNLDDFRNKLYVDLKKLDVLGRIYVSKEGINAQISIPEHLLDNFKKYINFIESKVGVSIKLVSLGPDREETIYMK